MKLDECGSNDDGIPALNEHSLDLALERYTRETTTDGSAGGRCCQTFGHSVPQAAQNKLSTGRIENRQNLTPPGCAGFPARKHLLWPSQVRAAMQVCSASTAERGAHTFCEKQSASVQIPPKSLPVIDDSSSLPLPMLKNKDKIPTRLRSPVASLALKYLDLFLIGVHPFLHTLSLMIPILILAAAVPARGNTAFACLLLVIIIVPMYIHFYWCSTASWNVLPPFSTLPEETVTDCRPINASTSITVTTGCGPHSQPHDSRITTHAPTELGEAESHASSDCVNAGQTFGTAGMDMRTMTLAEDYGEDIEVGRPENTTYLRREVEGSSCNQKLRCMLIFCAIPSIGIITDLLMIPWYITNKTRRLRLYLLLRPIIFSFASVATLFWLYAYILIAYFVQIASPEVQMTPSIDTIPIYCVISQLVASSTYALLCLVYLRALRDEFHMGGLSQLLSHLIRLSRGQLSRDAFATRWVSSSGQTLTVNVESLAALNDASWEQYKTLLRQDITLRHLNLTYNCVGPFARFPQQLADNKLKGIASAFRNAKNLFTLNSIPLRHIGDNATRQVWLENAVKNDANVVWITCALAQNAHNIEEFNISYNRLDDLMVRAVANMMARSTSISQLELSGTGLRDRHIEVLVQSFLRNVSLHKLHLSHNKIGEKGASAIAAFLKAHPQLSHVYLNGNRFGMKGMLTIKAAIRSNARIQVCELSWGGTNNK